MNPTSITDNLELIVKNTVTDMVNRAKRTLTMIHRHLLLKKKKKTMWCPLQRKTHC